MEKEIINRFQLWLLTVNYTLNSAILLLPSIIVFNSQQDGWLSMLIAMFIGAGMMFLYVVLANRHPDKNLVQMNELLFGKYLGKAVSLLYAWFFLHLSAIVMRDAGDFININIMSKTPVFFFIMMAAILIYLTVIHGIEVIARSNELFTPYAITGFWLTILFVVPLFELDNLKPVFAEGIKPVMRGIVPTLGFPYAELVAFLMLFPFVDNRKHLKKVFISAGLIAGFSLFTVVASTILVLGVKPTELSIFATYQMARLVNIGDFLTRVEAIIALSFVIVIFTKIVVTFYSSIAVIAEVFELKDYRSLIIPFLIITVSFNVVFVPNSVELLNFTANAWTPYALFFGLFIPMILVILSKLKEIKANK